jgi:L-lactate dehydrogenase complex protein LldG
MKTAKEDILKQIRNALAGTAIGSDDSVDRDYRQHGILNAEDRLSLFEDRLRDYGCSVTRSSEHEIAEAIARILTDRGKRALIRPVGIPESWLPSGFSFPIDDAFSYHELDGVEGVITGCAVAISETGTIVLRHTREEGRRAITLIPDYHLCIVFASEVVETVVEGFREMNSFSRIPITTISGPSATSDIEMIRVQGVHGPRTLDVLLVLDTEAV